MKCAVHADVEATGYCRNCGKALCPRVHARSSRRALLRGLPRGIADGVARVARSFPVRQTQPRATRIRHWLQHSDLFLGSAQFTTANT